MADKFVVRQKKPDKKEDKSVVMTLQVKGAIPVTGVSISPSPIVVFILLWVYHFCGWQFLCNRDHLPHSQGDCSFPPEALLQTWSILFF